MKFTIKDNNLLFDIYSMKTMHLSTLLIKFLNLNISEWFNEYQSDKSNKVFDYLFELTAIKKDTPINLIEANYLEFLLNELIKGSLDQNELLDIKKEYDDIKKEVIDTMYSANSTHDLLMKSSLNLLEESDELNPIIGTKLINLVTRFNALISIEITKMKHIQDNFIELTEEYLIKKNKITVSSSEDLGLLKTISYEIRFYNGEIFEFYDMASIIQFGSFIIPKLYNNISNIKRCENCGDFFIAVDPRELYCDKVYFNNRTCKEVGYENKIKSDEVLKKYKRIYKNKNAQKNRNKNNPNEVKRYNDWNNKATIQLKEYRDGNITNVEF